MDNRIVQKIILSNTCWALINAVPIAIIAPRFRRGAMFLTCTIVVYTVWTVASARFAIENTATAAVPILVFISVCCLVSWCPSPKRLPWLTSSLSYLRVNRFRKRSRAKSTSNWSWSKSNKTSPPRLTRSQTFDSRLQEAWQLHEI
ncbi:hypothetical protein F5Y06DRAFT_269992 [Hypoxylon sp. FL0890]|nr:hypothetical protein F5Y06DRAFT_269992 [Hypoxylon sp. FL0890]